MEREKPEHLERLPRDRSSGMVWIIGLGALMVTLAVLGWRIYAATGERWEARFNRPHAGSATLTPDGRTSEAFRDGYDTGRRDAVAELEPRLTELEYQIRAWERGDVKCVGNSVFRRFDNGWENIPTKVCRPAR